MSTSGANVRHGVTIIQHLKARTGMSYRSLCGIQLKLDASASTPSSDSGNCPKCMAIAGITDDSDVVYYEAK